MALHNNGHVKNQSKKDTWSVTAVILQSLHCGYTSLEHNWKVHHSADELELGHATEEELLELVRCMVTGTYKPKSCTRERPPAPPRPLPLAPSGNPLWRSRVRPWTDVLKLSIALYKALASAGAWITLPKEVTLPIIGLVSLRLQTP